MALRGSKKELSVRHENYVANMLDGRRSKSSGAAVTDRGDVTADPYNMKLECKMTSSDKKPVMVQRFEKIAVEAYEVGKTPGLALRYYDPKSPIANRDGWIDLLVMNLRDAPDLLDKVDISE